MLIAARLIGLYFAVSGVAFICAPGSLKKYMSFWSRGRKLYIVGAVRLLSAGILLSVVPQCRFKFVMAAAAVLNAALGVPYFIRGKEGMKAMLSRWETRSVKAVRILGLVSFMAGVLIFISA